jgi:hypothetical protein
MKSDPRIVDARRRARAAAHATGTSYQKTLDEIARSVGHRDWNEFVADPRSLPDEAMPAAWKTAGEAPTVEEDRPDRPAWHRRPFTRCAAALAACLAVAASLYWSASLDERTAATNAGLAWERTTVVSSRMRSRFRDNDRSMYVLATPLPGDRRDVRLVMLDNRPSSNPIVTRLLIGAGLLDTGTRTYTNYMGGDGIFRVFNRHPVARLHHRVDCNTGIDRSIETEIADDLTSTPVAVIPTYRSFPTRLDAEDLRSICSKETLERSARVARGY